MGRPSKFTEALNEKIKVLYQSGKTDRQVAAKIGISERTLHYWKLKYPEFLQSIKESKSVADDLVESTLFELAVEQRNVTACIFWLKNRRPHEWSDRRVLDIPQPGITAAATVKSFEEFCAAAGYPKPFPKQVEMASFCLDGSDPRMVLGARGYGKTDYITILGVANRIYLNRDLTVLIVTKSQIRNTAIIGEIAASLKANGVVLETENSKCLKVAGSRGKDLSVEVITVKGSLRGRHPNLIVMDDPVTDEDVSEAMRTLVKRKYNEAMKLTKNICIIGQPAHKYDLFAELRDLVKLMEVPHGTIPELDHDLEAQRLAGVDEASIQASYFLKIVSEGAMPFEAVNYIDKFPPGDSVAFLDPSHKGKDTSAISILKAHFEGLAVVGWAEHRAWNHWLDFIVPKLLHYGVKKLAIECNGLGDQPVIMVRQLLKDKGIGVVGIDSTDNKHARIMAAGAYAHLLHLSRESNKKYLDQVVKYEYNAEHDDAPDSLASGMKWIGLIRGKG